MKSSISKYISMKAIQLYEDDTSGEFGKPLWRHFLYCNALLEFLLRFACNPESQLQT